MKKILQNYFFAFLILIALNIFLVTITGNGYLTYGFFFLYGLTALLALVSIFFYVGSRYKGTRIYILSFVILIIIGVYLTNYGGELYGKFLLYRSERNFPPALEKSVFVEEDPISVEGKEIIPFSKHKWLSLENYTISEKNGLIALYRDSRLQDGDLEVFLKKFDTAGNEVDSLSFYHSEKQERKIFLVEDCLIDISNRTYNNAWFTSGDKEFHSMKLVEGSQKWNFRQVKDFHYNRSKESSYCHIIEAPYWQLSDKDDFPKSGDPRYMIVFLKDNQLYYYLTSYDITDFYFYNEHYVIEPPKHTSASLLLACRNQKLYNEDHLDKGEKSSQRTHIDPVYYLDKYIECSGLEPLRFLRSFEVEKGMGELYYQLRIDDKVLPLKTRYRIYKNHERSVKSPTYYWENGTETLEMCKNIYLYSNKNLKYYLLYTPMGTYIIK